MLQGIVATSLRRRQVILVLAVTMLVAGSYAAQHANVGVFPEFTPPQVVLQTEAPGLSAIEVERLVTQPIEAVAHGLPRLLTTRSQSIQGLSVVRVLFRDGTDVHRARQWTAERLAELAGTLPEGVKPPRLEPLTPATGRLLTVGFTSDSLTPLQLRDRVQWEVRPRLLAVEGVAQIILFGGEEKQLQVQVHPEFLAARQVALGDVIDAARQAGGTRGAGFQENAGQRLTLRVEGQVTTPAELGDTVLSLVDGAPVRLRDVAQVVEAAEPKFGDASVNGKPGVLLIVYRQFEGDSSTITRRVEAELQRSQPALEREGIVYHPALFRQANYIELAIGNVREALLIGAGLVVAVLLLFLGNWRTAFISLTAIPLSLLSAILILWGVGVSLNTLTLGGLAIAVGEVVDDAIIDVENIFRRLHENAGAAEPRSPATVVLAAALEVRGAVVYATFLVALVFVPVFFLSGLQGRLFAPLGYAYVLAVLASLAVALTVTPALALILLPQAGGSSGPRFVHSLQTGYDRLLRRLDGHVPLLLTMVIVLLTAAAWVVADFGGEFLPELRENHFVVHMRGLPGTSLRQSLSTGARLSDALRRHPAIRSVAQAAGRAELSEDVWGVEYSELEVDLAVLDGEGFERAERFLRATLARQAGFSFEMMPFLTERIQETLSGSTAGVVVKVFGADLDVVDRVTESVAEALDGIPGSADVRTEAQTGNPEVVIRLRRHEANRLGLRPGAILDTLHTAYQGTTVGQVYDRNRVLDIKVVLEPKARNDPRRIGDLRLRTAGAVVPLSQVADIYFGTGRFLVAHENGMRRQLVTCNVRGRDTTSFASEVERRLAQMPMPAGVTCTVTGEHEARRAAQRELSLGSALTGVGVLVLLGMALPTLRSLALVLANLPFTLLGGIAALYLTGGILDVGGLIGFVTLFGITVRNSLMMVSHWHHLHDVEAVPWGADLVIRGARERLLPVLMTALVTGLGLLPIALGSGAPGREVEGPMAFVILGGLATSTALNLLLLPLLFRRWGMEKALPETTVLR